MPKSVPTASGTPWSPSEPSLDRSGDDFGLIFDRLGVDFVLIFDRIWDAFLIHFGHLLDTKCRQMAVKIDPKKLY